MVKIWNLFWNLRIWFCLADETGSSIVQLKSEIDKNILKDLLNQNIDYRHKVIRLLAEICKEGNNEND